MPLSDADQELMELQRAMSSQGTTVAGMPSGAAASDPETILTWEQRRAAQREAYGQYVAAGDIWIGNCMAFTVGQQVPLEHVINYDLVEREQVNRIASPELARSGKRFEADEDFVAANPHIARQLKAVKTSDGASIPPHLDPRGAGAAKDDEKQEAVKASEPKRAAPASPAKTTGGRVSKDDEKAEG